MQFIKQPDGEVRLGDWLKDNLANVDTPWNKFTAVVAF
jgi:hypothetical protein